MKIQIRIAFLLLCFGFANRPAIGQVNSPETTGAYRSGISNIDIIQIDTSSVRFYISSENPNSLFYSDITFSAADSEMTDGFFTLPDADDNLDSGIRNLSADSRSRHLFFTNNGQLFSISPLAGSLKELCFDNVHGLKAQNGRLFFLTGPGLTLHFGKIDSTRGLFVESTESPVPVFTGTLNAPNGVDLFVNPVNKSIYISWEGSPANIIRSDVAFDSLDHSSTFSMVGTSGMGFYDYATFGMGPDGRLFAGANAGFEPNQQKFLSWTDDDGANWDTVNTGIGGVIPSAITCGFGSNYAVYFGSAFSTNKGQVGTWANLGWQSFETHPNEGPVATIPFLPGFVFMATDKGLGISTDYGASIFEISDTVATVQANKFKAITLLMNKMVSEKSL